MDPPPPPPLSPCGPAGSNSHLWHLLYCDPSLSVALSAFPLLPSKGSTQTNHPVCCMCQTMRVSQKQEENTILNVLFYSILGMHHFGLMLHSGYLGYFGCSISITCLSFPWVPLYFPPLRKTTPHALIGGSMTAANVFKVLMILVVHLLTSRSQPVSQPSKLPFS